MIRGEEENLQPQQSDIESVISNKNELSFVDRFRERTPSILADFFINQKIDNYKTEEIKITRKSIYGSVEIEEKKYFFKISKPETILMELQGYRLASEYPHEKVISHSFSDEYGIYLQDFCSDIDGERGLLVTESNSILLSDEGKKQKDFLSKTRRIFSLMGDICEKTLIKTPQVLRGQNDAFFYDRVQNDGRIDQLYRGKEIPLENTIKNIGFDKFSQFSLVINGKKSEANIAELIAKARISLSPDQKRYFVLSQGDPTERNLTINGTFLDFEVAGINSFIQDVAIFACYNYFGGHYITPRYSNIEGMPNFEGLKKFSDSVSIDYSIDKNEKEIKININFPYPPLKAEMLRQYNEEVVKRVECCIPEVDRKQLVSQLQSAILLRLMGVKNLLRFKEKDLMLSLGLVGYFSGITANTENISQFLEEKFKSLSF